MRMDRRGVSVDRDRIEVKPIGEAADDRQLILVRSRRRAGRWRSRFSIGVRGPRSTRIRVREGQVILGSHGGIYRFCRPGRDAHVERIDYLAIAIEDADFSRRTDARYVLEGQL